MTTENTEIEQSKPWQFQKGRSGNPAGKPRGTRHKTTLAVQALLDGEAEEITRKAIEAAKAGDMTAIRLVLERVAPARKDYPVSFDLPEVNSTADAARAMAALMAAVAEGSITPSEGSEVTKLIDAYVRTLSAHELIERLTTLEGLQKK